MLKGRESIGGFGRGAACRVGLAAVGLLACLACGPSEDPRLQEFATKFGEIRPGMPRAKVVELMGAPKLTQHGDRLDTECVKMDATEALSYAYTHDFWLDRFTGQPPPVTWFVVCLSKEGAVVSTHMAMERT